MTLASWRIALASSIGTSHSEAGSPCQDYATCDLIEGAEGKVLIAVVSDGAGSAARAEAGSELATQTLALLVRGHFENGGQVSGLTRETASGWIGAILSAISARAELDECEVREYSCTLLAAIVGPADAAFLQIGDGAIVVSHGEEDGWSYLFWPQHGEFANSTNFVTSPQALEALEFDVAPRRIDELALFTDGIENLVLHHASRSVHEPFFDQMFPAVRASKVEGLDAELSDGLRRYLSGPAVCERTDDDKTLVLATRAKTAEVTVQENAPGQSPVPTEAAECPTS